MSSFLHFVPCGAGVVPKVQGATAIWDNCSGNSLSSLSANTRGTGHGVSFFQNTSVRLSRDMRRPCLRSSKRSLSYVPLDDLSIQWDTAIEFAILEGVLPHSFDNPKVHQRPG